MNMSVLAATFFFYYYLLYLLMAIQLNTMTQAPQKSN